MVFFSHDDILRDMKVDRYTVTEWLKRHNRDRQWLADRLSVGLSAVGNWLNLKGQARKIPAEHILTIQRLMEEDEASEAERPQHTVILEFDDQTFSQIERAALKDGNTIREWAVKELNQAANEDMREIAAAYLGRNDKVTPFDPSKSDSKLARQEYRFVGPCAAGEPVEAERDDVLLIQSQLDPKRHVIYEVNGRSAEPMYMDGDRILVETFPGETRTARKGVPAVFRDRDGCYLKIYEGNGKPLRSVNPDANDLIPSDGMQLVGYPVEKVDL